MDRFLAGTHACIRRSGLRPGTKDFVERIESGTDLQQILIEQFLTRQARGIRLSQSETGEQL